MMSDESKEPLNDEERLALCQKLDQELDDFINSLERKKYTDGWSEETWEEEMDKHPFFMKGAPENGELSPLAEGLAKLKYDPNENTPLELATSYKDDGNFNYKHKNYRLAIMGYTEGIKVKCGDQELEASLYNNRAAAHWQLKNYRSSLIDSEKALKYNPNHTKAQIRAAKAAYEASRYDKCIEYCQKLLENIPNNNDISELLKKAKKSKAIQERDLRKKERADTKYIEQKESIINTIISRGIKVSNCDDEDDIDLSKLEPALPGAQDAIVHIEDGCLKWPVLFLYPEYQLTDLVKACPENVSLLDQLEQLLEAPWDEEKKYRIDTVNVYFEGYDKMPHVVNAKLNLGDLLVSKYFELKAGTPAFFVLPKGSAVERRFLESYI